MNQMIQKGIHEYPGDNATITQLYATIPSMFRIKFMNNIFFFFKETLQIVVRSSVFYIQEVRKTSSFFLEMIFNFVMCLASRHG